MTDTTTPAALEAGDGLVSLPLLHRVVRLLHQKIDEGLNRPIKARLAEIEARLAEIETQTKSSAPYRRVWRASEAYAENDFVTSSGSLWACRQTGTTSRPGVDATWQLAAKGTR